jgi:hypothetical protein
MKYPKREEKTKPQTMVDKAQHRNNMNNNENS